MNRIDIAIFKDGSVDLKLSGFDGLSCLDTTRTIEYLLGDENIKRKICCAKLNESITANPGVAPIKASN